MNQISNIAGSHAARIPSNPSASAFTGVGDAPERSSPAQGNHREDGPAAAPGRDQGSSQALTSAPGAAAGSKPTIASRVAQAREKPEDGKVYALYAAALAHAEGWDAAWCPFMAEGEEKLRAEWHWYFETQAKVRHRARPAEPPAEYRKAERRKYVPPKNRAAKPIQTTSAAYAEQLGVEAVEGEG